MSFSDCKIVRHNVNQSTIFEFLWLSTLTYSEISDFIISAIPSDLSVAFLPCYDKDMIYRYLYVIRIVLLLSWIANISNEFTNCMNLGNKHFAAKPQTFKLPILRRGFPRFIVCILRSFSGRIAREKKRENYNQWGVYLPQYPSCLPVDFGTCQHLFAGRVY